MGMDTFHHTPLDHSKECIRLLRFLDQPPSSGLDHFALEAYDIATAPRFVALSYTWGMPNPSHDIIVDGLLLPIGENLRVALKALRSFFPDKAPALENSSRWKYRGRRPPKDLLQDNGYPLLWVDAICINQSDPLEKNHQVNMMGAIFSTAERVISWLGDEADDSSSVMRAIRATTYTRQYPLEVKQATKAFVKRPYWRRMWVVQEFVLPRDLVILCGLEGAWWEDLNHFWVDEKIISGPHDGDRYFHGGAVQSRGEGGLHALVSARQSRRGSSDDGYEEGTVFAPIEEILTMFSYGECSDPRDRIYALLTLIKPGTDSGFEPLLADYSISAEHLYYRVLGYVRPMLHRSDWRGFREELGKALCSCSWADSEATKLNEVVYKIVEIWHSYCEQYDQLSQEDWRPFTEVQESLAKDLGRFSGGMLFNKGPTYHAIIRCFQAFPRDEDPETWWRFDELIRWWLQMRTSQNRPALPRGYLWLRARLRRLYSRADGRVTSRCLISRDGDHYLRYWVPSDDIDLVDRLNNV